MRVFYLDPGLLNNIGHHANFCRYIVGELRSRNIETFVFGQERTDAELTTELGARPLFKAYTYFKFNRDPLCGWLIDFSNFARSTAGDFEGLADVEPTDVVYMSTATPAQLMAASVWLRKVPAPLRPRIVIEITDTGLKASRNDGGAMHFAAPDVRENARATLFRYAAARLGGEATNIHFVSFDAALSGGIQ